MACRDRLRLILRLELLGMASPPLPGHRTPQLAELSREFEALELHRTTPPS